MKYHICILLLFFFLVTNAFSQWQSIGNVDSVSANGSRLVIHAGTAVLNLSFLAEDLVRVRLAPHGTFGQDRSWAVIKENWPAVTPEVHESDRAVSITTRELSLVINKKPLRLNFLDKSGNVLNEDDPANGMGWDNAGIRVWKKMPIGEQYYGFGEKAGTFNRRNTAMTMWNSDIPAYAADTDPLYQAHPFFYGVNNGIAYGIFFDNSYWSSFDMGKEDRSRYSFGADGAEINYYFFYGPSPRNVLSRYTELVGRMPLPPRWSLGYQQCRWSYPNEKRVREIAAGFRSRNIPCDVIYLDIDYMDGYRIFTWNNKNFPNPKGMIDDLRKQGFRVAVIVDPGIKADSSYHAFRSGTAADVFLKYPDGRPFIGKVWPGLCEFPDFTNENARKWWGDNFSVLIESGIRGWWNDMNEPSVFDVPSKTVDLDVVHNDNGFKSTHAANHNIYGMQMTRATYEGVRRLLPGERPFVLTRASYAGGHRYSAAWTGDNTSTWMDLSMNVSMCLNLSISGQPFVGADIGGFIGHPTGELFARWLQLGVFTPLMRAHSVINEKNKEPWEYGDDITDINRNTINLRYSLLPYIYNVMYQASVTGMPAMRPMMFEFPQDRAFTNTQDQFMFGDCLLIAPVLTPAATGRSVRLPEGTWYDYWTGQPFSGGKDVEAEAPLSRIPIFVKAGAIIPSQQPVQFTGQAPIDPLTLTVYPAGTPSESSYYEDDGTSFEYEKGVYFSRTIRYASAGNASTLTLEKAEGVYAPPARSILIRVVATLAKPGDVELNGKSLQRTAGPSVVSGTWTWNDNTKVLEFRIPETGRQMVIRIR